VVVHEAPTSRMDFVTKNFRYVTKRFDEFLNGIAAGERLYMRAASAAQPTERPASLEVDFPSLAPDFILPPQLEFVYDEARCFSSVLRIQGEVEMWLHYDVCLAHHPIHSTHADGK
jgi:tRNA wybutosine-synthesizing protein 4